MDNPIQIINSEKDTNDSKEAEIMRLGVSKAWRRQGVGTILLNHAKQFCIDQGYERLIASTMNVLDDAIYFYKLTGFTLINQESCGNTNENLKFFRFVLDF